MGIEGRRVVFSGRVQGVGFRFTVSETCRALGLGGWVRNEPDGTVLAEIHGRADLVDEAIERIREQRARYLRDLHETPVTLGDDAPGEFEIRY